MEWISVKDRLPPSDTFVILNDKDRKLVCEGVFHKGNYITPSDYSDGYLDIIIKLDAVTHWMPLPEPPKQ